MPWGGGGAQEEASGPEGGQEQRVQWGQEPFLWFLWKKRVRQGKEGWECLM